MTASLRHAIQALCARKPFARLLCWHGMRRGNRVALTFDDGPRPDFTPAVLELLAHAGADATFFLEGRRVEKHPDLVRRIVAARHEIGNHGFEHDEEPLGEQRRRCAEALAVCGIRTRLFRPPLGRLSAGQFLAAALSGYRTVLWSLDAHDSMRHEGKWAGPAPDYDAAGAGDIVLLHDDNPVCLRELPALLRCLKRKGLRAVSISELFA